MLSRLLSPTQKPISQLDFLKNDVLSPETNGVRSLFFFFANRIQYARIEKKKRKEEESGSACAPVRVKRQRLPVGSGHVMSMIGHALSHLSVEAPLFLSLLEIDSFTFSRRLFSVPLSPVYGLCFQLTLRTHTAGGCHDSACTQ